MQPSVAKNFRPVVIFSVLISLIAYFIITSGATTNAAGPISLGIASTFGILTATGVTSSGPETLIGDLGSYPTATMNQLDTR